MVLGECFSVSRAEKTVFMYQVSDKMPPEHPFTATNVLDVYKSLHMGDVKGNEYTLAIVYLVNHSNVNIRGLAFKQKSTKDKLLTLGEASVLTDEGCKVQGYIVRAPLSPGSKRAELPGDIPLSVLPGSTVFVAAKGKTFHLVETCGTLKKSKKVVKGKLSSFSNKKEMKPCQACSKSSLDTSLSTPDAEEGEGEGEGAGEGGCGVEGEEGD